MERNAWWHSSNTNLYQELVARKHFKGNKQPSGPRGLNISRERNWSYVEEWSICVLCYRVCTCIYVWLMLLYAFDYHPRMSLWFEMKLQTQMFTLAQPPVVSRSSVTWQQPTKWRHSLLPGRWLATPRVLGHPQTIPTSCFIYSNAHTRSGVPASHSSRRNDPVSGMQPLMRTITAAPTYQLWLNLLNHYRCIPTWSTD